MTAEDAEGAEKTMCIEQESSRKSLLAWDGRFYASAPVWVVEVLEDRVILNTRERVPRWMTRYLAAVLVLVLLSIFALSWDSLTLSDIVFILLGALGAFAVAWGLQWHDVNQANQACAVVLSVDSKGSVELFDGARSVDSATEKALRLTTDYSPKWLGASRMTKLWNGEQLEVIYAELDLLVGPERQEEPVPLIGSQGITTSEDIARKLAEATGWPLREVQGKTWS